VALASLTLNALLPLVYELSTLPQRPLHRGCFRLCVAASARFSPYITMFDSCRLAAPVRLPAITRPVTGSVTLYTVLIR
jgi:hypothetical protein